MSFTTKKVNAFDNLGTIEEGDVLLGEKTSGTTGLITFNGTNITSLGTITSGTWQADTLAVLYGGTGQTSYTDGQLLIGNSTGNTLTKATLTGGTNLTVSNGGGSITLDVDDAFLLNTGDTGTGSYTFTGDSDAVQLKLTGNSVQTSNIFEVENSSATTLFSIDNSGNVDLAASTSLTFNGTAILADSAGTTTLSNVDALDATTQETVEDVAGGLVATGGTKTGISVTYQDSTGDMDFVVSDTTVAGDTGSTGITPGDTLTIAGGTDVTTAMSGDTLTVNADVVGGLDGASLTDITPTTSDKILLQDADDNDNLKTATAQEISDLTDSYKPFVNILADNGRFDLEGDSFNYALSDSGSPFDRGDFLATYNSSTAAQTGKFIFDNSTNGGAAGALTTTTSDLLTAMGRTGSALRFGVEFRICEITGGSGTAASVSFGSGTKYLATVNGLQAVLVSDGYTTFTAWVRATSGNLGINAASLSEFYVDGVSQSGAYEVEPADGWVHVRMVLTNALGYNNSFPFLYSTSGDTFEIACAGVYTGKVDVGLHTSPLISQNTQEYAQKSGSETVTGDWTFSGTSTFTGDNDSNSLAIGDESELTIATGAVTATSNFHIIDTESDAASDDLDTISGGRVGQILVITAANDARTVVAKDGTGNLDLAGDFSMDNTQDTLTLIYSAVSSSWKELSRSDNGA